MKGFTAILILFGYVTYCLTANSVSLINLQILFYFISFIGKLTEEQVIQAGKLMRKSCKSKTKSEDAELDQIKSGNFKGITKKGKCYVACILQMTRLVSPDGHLDYNIAKSRVPTLPEPRRAPTLHALEVCKDEGLELTDKCEIAFILAQCFYNDTPEYYLVP
ncbi:general odorant-binding protein 72 isoform X2 [Onthophagus taurus]|uniref:general odorant-binding protein 72 isoform X2 n=1 Tax=Onthophagus taurus TaxID=166361 RepID=UPI000C203684|nr:general odorant-binding protein 72 isoform X2 [Onthophagus taurus]